MVAAIRADPRMEQLVLRRRCRPASPSTHGERSLQGRAGEVEALLRLDRPLRLLLSGKVVEQ